MSNIPDVGNQAPIMDEDNSSDEQGKSGATWFSSWTYALLFVIFDIAGVAMMQWGVTISSSRASLSSPFIGFWGFVSAMWTQGRFVIVLNLLVLGLIYAAILFVFNRFWVATPIVMAICMIFGVVEHFKVMSRYETVLPADFDFLGSDAGNIATFLPSGAQWTILGAVGIIIVIIILCVFAHHIDSRKGRILTGGNTLVKVAGRIAGVGVPVLVVIAFIVSVGTVGSWANAVSSTMGDIPSMWDSVYDAQRNGTLVAFSRQLNPKVMDEPSGYSEATMKQIVARYEKEAKTLNATRTASLDDSSVMYILSESFSDPTCVPGITLNEDPMPQIRAIKKNTTSGLMLSSGYGGGTANLEYQALTGLSMANFDSSLTSPYQQLVPSLSWTPTINQAWNDGKNSAAFHPYQSSMYSRSTDYKKFGFTHFYTLNEPDVIAYQKTIDNSPYVGDESAYKSALEWLDSSQSSRFAQVVTMQNHMPYKNWYNDNQFSVTPSAGAQALGSDETMSINTYSKGVNLTDTATQSLLDSLDTLSKPVTVVFYGDHLPGIYTTAGADSKNSLALHETDYFIWSNKASQTQGAKNADAAYSSPNFFMAQMAEHMNAKVSPYLAFLTQLHTKISAMEPPVVNKIQGWDRIPEGQTIYLDDKGQPMSEKDFDAATKQLLKDYKLIQYDITAGKQYLEKTDFMAVTDTAKATASTSTTNAKKSAAKTSAQTSADAISRDESPIIASSSAQTTEDRIDATSMSSR